MAGGYISDKSLLSGPYGVDYDARWKLCEKKYYLDTDRNCMYYL